MSLSNVGRRFLSISATRGGRGNGTSVVSAGASSTGTIKTPFQSHLTSATAHFRTIQRPTKGNSEEQNDPKPSGVSRDENNAHTLFTSEGGRIRREPLAPAENDSPPQVNVSRGRLIRNVKTNPSAGGSIAAATSATAQYRQSRINRTNNNAGISNPSSVAIPLSNEKREASGKSISESEAPKNYVETQQQIKIAEAKEAEVTKDSVTTVEVQNESSRGSSRVGGFFTMVAGLGGGCALSWGYNEGYFADIIVQLQDLISQLQ